MRSRSEQRQRQRRRRIASFAVLALVVAGSPWWSVWLAEYLAGELTSWNSHFKVNQVVVTGCKILPVETITTLAKIPTRHSMFTLPIGPIEKRVEQNPWVKSAKVVRRLPDTVELVIVERTPVAAVRGDRLMVLTADSMAIAPPPDNWVWDLPIVAPTRSVRFDDGKRVTDKPVLELLHQTLVAQKVSNDVWKNISEIYFRGGQIRAMINTPPVEIVVGEDVGELAWIGLLHYLKQSDSRDNDEAISLIDLRIPGKIVVTHEPLENVEPVTG